MKDKLRKNVLGVIFDHENNVLIVSRANDPLHWQFPQGGVNWGEPLEDAIIRELGEELNTKKFTIIAQCPEKHIYKWAKTLIRDENIGQEQTIFLLRFNGNTSEIKVDDRELGGFLWVPPEKVNVFLQEYLKPVWNIVTNNFNLPAFTPK